MITRTQLLAMAFMGVASGSALAAEQVTAQSYIRAETDFVFSNFVKNAGGKINQFFYISKPTALDQQPVIRMNRDTLYAAAVVDTEGGATVTIPPLPDQRYVSLMVIDNDHYAPMIFHHPGTYRIPGDTKYVTLIQRIQLMDPTDAEELALINQLQRQFSVQAASADPFPTVKWDRDSMLGLRARYEKEFQTYEQYAPDWGGARGKVNEKTRHLGVAGAWGVFPEKEAVYINYQGPSDPRQCYVASYPVPENNAFWSITVYGSDGFMQSENNVLNEHNVRLDGDGGFTVHYGSEQACGAQPNRLDITEGWNFLMRVYRPGPSVLSRSYTLPEVSVVGQ